MRQDRRFQRKRWLDDERKRMIPVIVIPAIVICLMVIIVFADHIKEAKAAAAVQPSDAVESMQGQEPSGEQDEALPGDDGSNHEEPADDGETEPQTEENEETEPEQTEPENTEPYVTETFQRDSSPEILDLMKRYFKARTEADAETMNQLYGVGEVSVTALEEQKTRMRSNAKYINSIDNVVTYVTDGAETDSWLVYAVADIKFYSAKKAAPMIMWCYVVKNAEGNYQILNNELLSPEQQKLVNNINHSESVRRLASDVNNRLKEALNSDDDLREIYGVLRDGSPVWKGEEDEEQVKILDEPEDSGTGAADSAEDGEEASEADQEGLDGTDSGTEAEDAESGDGTESPESGAGAEDRESGDGAESTESGTGTESAGETDSTDSTGE